MKLPTQQPRTTPSEAYASPPVRGHIYIRSDRKVIY